MAEVCILTDSTAQFPTPVFEGRQRVHVIPLHIRIGEELHPKGGELKASDLPRSIKPGQGPEALPPTVTEFEKMYAALGGHYEEVVVILHPAHLTPALHNARLATESVHGGVKIQVIDGHTTAIGLGLVVQAAAAAAEQGMPAAEIDRYVRGVMPKVYTLFCIEGLGYLHRMGFLGAPQAVVGEMLKVLPLFVFENSMLTHTQKARNHRHLVDILQEFLNEFEELEHIAFLQGVPPFENETRALRERIAEDFTKAPSISEHIINAPLASIIGPRSLGIFLLQP